MFSEKINEEYDEDNQAQCFDYGGVLKYETTYYDDNKKVIKKDISYYSGLHQSVDTLSKEMTVKYGKTSLLYKDVHYEGKKLLDSVTINSGLPNQTKFDIQIDNSGNIVDVLLPKNSIYSISKRIKNKLIEVLNNKSFGSDFDIKVNINKIIIEKINHDE